MPRLSKRDSMIHFKDYEKNDQVPKVIYAPELDANNLLSVDQINEDGYGVYSPTWGK